MGLFLPVVAEAQSSGPAKRRWRARRWPYRSVLTSVLLLQGLITVVYFLYVQQQLQSPVAPQDPVGVSNRDELRAVAFDRGGWDALSPVLTLAAIEGVRVSVYLGGASARHFHAGLISVDSRLEVSAAAEEWDDMHVQEWLELFVREDHGGTVVATSASEEGTMAAVVAICKSHAPSAVLVEDTYGTSVAALAEVTHRCTERAAGLLVTVGDAIAESVLRSRVQRFQGRTSVTGAPQFDAVAAMLPDMDTRRRRLRAHLRLSTDDVLVLVAGQPRGTHEMLRLLHEAVVGDSGRETQRRAGAGTGAGVGRIRLLLRQHPRATAEERLAAAQFKTTMGTFMVEADAVEYPTTVDLLPAADVVMSGFSTTNYFAILLGLRDVVYAGTPQLLADLQAEKGLQRPPETTAGAGWFVDTPEALREVLEGAGAAEESAAAARVRAAQQALVVGFDGQASKRVWSAVVEWCPTLRLAVDAETR